MTHDDIIDMAAQAGINEATWFYDDDVLEKFAALIAAAEREACAKVCDQLSWKLNDDITRAAFTMAADTIRARGER